MPDRYPAPGKITRPRKPVLDRPDIHPAFIRDGIVPGPQTHAGAHLGGSNLAYSRQLPEIAGRFAEIVEGIVETS